ncbi:MAG: tetratricopeptide repeat protein [Acidobacteria bacterium]|nr:tetratricopeptide repeat protein [Acidobacteriota bacterium]
MGKHEEKAERLLQKGKLEAALEEYLLAWKEDSSNDAAVQTVADLYQRLNRVSECRQCFEYLFDRYAERSDVTKATEFLRKLQRVGPVGLNRLLRGARLLEASNPEEAVEYYQQALQDSGGQEPELMLQCLQSLARLQPASLEIQARTAAVALKLGKTALAASAYQKMGELRSTEGRYAEAIEALEEAHRLSDGDPSTKLVLATACSKANRFPRVIELLSDAAAQSDNQEVLRLLAEAYLAEKQLQKAEPLYWKLLQLSPEAIHPLVNIEMQYLRQGEIPRALEMLQKLDRQLSASGRQRELISFAEKLSQSEDTAIPILEYLTRIFDRLHLDTPLSTTLNHLFDLYAAAGEFPKAADVLERTTTIDPYDPGSFSKLDRLEGKIERKMWNELASRLGKTPAPAETSAQESAEPEGEHGESPSPSGEGNALTDLILQTEIFLQYNLADKARERLERIAKLFPHEEEKNDELRQLYQRSRFKPRYAISPNPSVVAETQDFRSYLNRVSDVSRNLSRQGTVKGVLVAAVNDIGRLWQLSRCVVGLAAPNRPPSMAMEYIAPGIAPSDASLLGKLVMSLQQIIANQNAPLIAENVFQVPSLTALQASLTALQVQSLAALPLHDGEQMIGILVLEQCGEQRVWKSNDLAGVETLAEQIVLAVANVRLRNLMKALAVTDEESGLLHRDSYLPCLLSEAERMRAQNSPLAGAILDLSPPQLPSAKSGGKQSLDEFVVEFSNTVVSHLRQNDIALKYGPHSLALILPGTTGKDAVAVVEKLRRVTGTKKPPGSEGPPPLVVGVAETVRSANMDTADVITELINRLEAALEAAQQDGEGITKLLDPPPI